MVVFTEKRKRNTTILRVPLKQRSTQMGNSDSFPESLPCFADLPKTNSTRATGRVGAVGEMGCTSLLRNAKVSELKFSSIKAYI